MASFLDKFKVTTALDTSTTMDLSCTHITTADFMQVAPVYIKECVPGETIKMHQETFARLAPMSVPTFGRALIHNRAFFVPMRTVFKKWNEFITDAVINLDVQGAGTGASTSVNVDSVPYIYNEDLVQFFVGVGTGSTDYATYSATTSSTHPAETFDIAVAVYTGTGATDSVVRYYNLTTKGRRFMKILQSLGYNIMWSTAASSAACPTAQYQNVHRFKMSALPLLSWVRIMLDWYYPSQYAGDSEYLFAKSILDNAPTSGGVYHLSLADLRTLFGSYSVFQGVDNYDSDYFVSAFDNPLGPTYGNSANVSMTDINYKPGTSSSFDPIRQGIVGVQSGNTSTNYGAPIAGTVDYAPAMVGTSKYTLTQYGLDALKALTDYVKRHQLVGARALDRMYARFGKSLDSAKLDRSCYIGAQNIPLTIGDVMSHAGSQEEALGNYAGKGVAYGNDGNFEFSTDEYGYFVVISSIVPQTGYYQGIDRNLLHLGRTEFWTPEFDQLGNQAISKCEGICPMNSFAECDNDSQGGDPSNYALPELANGIFGYTPRYSEYKIGRDKLTGDFRLASKNGVGDTSDAWHLMRSMENYVAQGPASFVHTRYFTQGFDWWQYNRIFNVEANTTDKFYMIHTFNVSSTSPMHSLYDTYKFENEDEGAKKVVSDVNGVKVN